MIWGSFEDAPAESNPSRAHLSDVRRWLIDGGLTDPIQSVRGIGYKVNIPDSQVDLRVAAREVTKAQGLIEGGDLVAAFRVLESLRLIAAHQYYREPIQCLLPLLENDMSLVRDARTLIRTTTELYYETAARLGLWRDIATDLTEVVNLHISDSVSLWHTLLGVLVNAGEYAEARHHVALAREALTPNAEAFPPKLDAFDSALRHGDQVDSVFPADPAAELAVSPSLPQRPIQATTTSSVALQLGVKDEIGRVRSRRVAGSALLTVGDIVGDDGLLVAPTVSPMIGDKRTVSLDDLPSAQPWMVVAGPGQGKSTLANLIFLKLASHEARSQDVVPILIDLADYRYDRDDASFGTEGWILSVVAERYLGGATSSKLTLDIDRLHLVVDSLDEGFAGLDAKAIHKLLTRPLFTRASVVFSRTHFYEHYLAHTSFARDRRLGKIEEWAPDDSERYAKAYFAFAYGSGSERRAEEFCSTFLRNSESLTELVRVPLRLNMALELADPGMARELKDVDLLTLHQWFILNWLNIEQERPGSTQLRPEKEEQLLRLAWEFYDDTFFGEEQPPQFTEAQITEVLSALDPDATKEDLDLRRTDLVERSLLRTGARRVDSLAGAISFQHKSFQEYLVAAWIYRAILASPEATVAVMRKYISPEVSEFLKEFFIRINRGHSKSLCVANLTQALRDLRRERDRMDVDAAGLSNRLSIQQVLYYLGNVRHPRAAESLRKTLDTESDLWVRRGVAVGLAFGGDEGPLRDYVDELRMERARGDSRLNAVNVGYHLSFFGDQTADPLKPDVDLGGTTVASTVSRLLYQLSTETDRASWPLDLYTIVDLGLHRPASLHSFRAAIRENSASARRVIRSLDREATFAESPERGALEQLVREIDGGET